MEIKISHQNVSHVSKMIDDNKSGPMSDMFEHVQGQTKVKVRYVDDKKEMMEGEILLYAHFW